MNAKDGDGERDLELGLGVVADTFRALHLIASEPKKPPRGPGTPCSTRASVCAVSVSTASIAPTASTEFPREVENSRGQAATRVCKAVLKTDLAQLARVAYPLFAGVMTEAQLQRQGAQLKQDVTALAQVARRVGARVQRDTEMVSAALAAFACLCALGEISATEAASWANGARRCLPVVYASQVEKANEERKNRSVELRALRVYTVLAKGSRARLQGSARAGLPSGPLGDLIRKTLAVLPSAPLSDQIRKMREANTALGANRKGSVGSVNDPDGRHPLPPRKGRLSPG